MTDTSKTRIKPLLGEETYFPSLFRCPFWERHRDSDESAPCQHCYPIEGMDAERAQRMSTLTKIQYWLLGFVYWNPGCLTEAFKCHDKLESISNERILVQAGRLVERGLLTCGRDDSGRLRWDSTEQTIDYLDEPAPH